MEIELNFKVKFQLAAYVNFKGGLMWPHLKSELKQYEARNRGHKRSNGLWALLPREKKNCASAVLKIMEQVPQSEIRRIKTCKWQVIHQDKKDNHQDNFLIICTKNFSFLSNWCSRKCKNRIENGERLLTQQWLLKAFLYILLYFFLKSTCILQGAQTEMPLCWMSRMSLILVWTPQRRQLLNQWFSWFILSPLHRSF